MTFELWLFAVGAALIICIVASKVAGKLGVPALLLFLAFGMIAGSEGLAGIDFDDALLARELGTIALALILFAGGLEAKWTEIKPRLGAGLSLATVGVLVTATTIAVVGHFALKLPPMIALLLGALVSSTDAAAVFGV